MSAGTSQIPRWRPWRQFAGLSTRGKVWLFSALLSALGAGLLLLVLADPAAPIVGLGLHWLVLAFGFYLAEVVVVHFQFRGQAHTFSLSEIPLVLGLVLLGPVEFVAANLLGAGLALAINRRQGPLKLAFNLSQFLLVAAVALAAYQLVLAALPDSGAGIWLAALAAVIAANCTGIIAVAGVISIVEGRFEGERLPQVIKFGLLVGFTNTCLALIAVILLLREPMALLLLVLPALLLYGAYRAYSSERQKHASLEFLYQATRILNSSRELDSAVTNLLGLAQRVFRSERAEICFFSPDGSAHGLRTVLPDGGGEGTVSRFSLSANDSLRARALAEREPFLYVAATSAKPLPQAELRSAMVALLEGESGPLGMIVVGNRLGDVGGFSGEDMRLFETLVSQTATALENGQLGDSLRHLSELKEQLQHQAYHDPLTGLGNRALLVDELERALAGDWQAAAPGILFIDMDDFKTVNDSLGHAAGDELLRAVSHRVAGTLRPDDLAVRLGGDEFAVLLRATDSAAAVRVAERILGRMEEPITISGQEMLAHLSIGMALAAPGMSSEDLLRDADVAMYSAKAEGKGRLAIFQPGMREAVTERHALKADLQRALARGEFVINYQPIADLDTSQVVGLEALLRWRHPERGLVSPAEFLSLAEESVLILSIGSWVLRQACERGRRWNELTPDHRPLTIHVNISARQIQQAGFVAEVAGTLAETRLDPSLLVLEVTETMLMREPEANAARLRELKQLGVKVAIDDFGTGWSTLSTLRDLPVDVLKMPREFLEGRRAEDADWKFAQAIVGLGHSLQLDVIAEGIERADQVRRLRQLGCNIGQGYLFWPPLPEEDIAPLLVNAAGAVA